MLRSAPLVFPALSALLTLHGCAPEDADQLEEGAISDTRVPMDALESRGVLTFLNASTTTQPLLDDDVGLDKRAATNLVAHRDGATSATSDDDRFDTIDEVDAVAYVGDSALSDLLDYARDNGWVPAGDDTYGTIETVTFTYTEAQAVVDLCNTASQETLDIDAGLDARAATNLVAQRPYGTLEAVAAVPYVGATALTRLKAFAALSAPADGATTAQATAALTTAADGLWFTSESDYPLVVWHIDHPNTTSVTLTNVKTVIAGVYQPRPDSLSLADRSVEKSTIAWAFDRYTVEQDWWEDYNREQQPKWQAVRDVFEHDLHDATVWRLGRKDSFGTLVGDIDVIVIGVSSDGGLVGFSTVAIET